MSSVFRAGLLAAIPMPLILIGRDERVVAANDMAREIFAGATPGHHYTGALRAPELVDCVETALRAGQTASVRHLSTDRRREVTWQVMAAPVGGSEAGTAAEVLVSFDDISEIEAAGRMRRDFVANVSHELKTPLTALTGFIETLRGPARDDPAARERFLGIMAQEVARMNRLVGDLLSLSRVESQERVRPTAPVDLGQVLSRVVSALGPLAAGRGVEIRVAEVEAGGRAVVPGDADQLAQVFTNLVENALKYAASGGRVDIAVACLDREPVLNGPAVAVTVTDRGPGFDPLHIPRLTERFYRIDAHRSRDEGGTGLGLAIVKHIVNRHRGRLRIESRPEKGSRFTVTLPRV